MDAVITNIGTLVRGPASGPHPGRDGPPEADDRVLDHVADAAIAIDDGTVVAAGPSAEVLAAHPVSSAATAVDAAGGLVCPGLVDAHTHAAFVGDRADEFTMKLRGKSYGEIADEGGGILRTVAAVRGSSEEAIADRLSSHLDVMLAHGSTTVEVKSGYGLDVEHELRLLRAIERVDHPVRVVPTFMGAHAVPAEERPSDYVDRVIDDQLPAVADQGIARFCDVFCDEGAFTAEQSRHVLEAARGYGLTPKLHADEFARIGGSALAADLGATSADHLLRSTPDDAARLADDGVTPVFLPATALALDTPYADPRPFLAAGCEIALATDFNPNCHAPALPFTAMLGCAGMRLTPAEAVRAVTTGATAALATDPEQAPAVSPRTGQLTPGSPADAVIFDLPAIDHLPYRFGENRVRSVLIDGTVVHQYDPPG